ncbi:hypothetical protein GXP67_07110 [Rhodocytophaga rosea]|uniref:DUF6265 domain-containing protein n=1 Tax=Rhodocytophaga rosea TaxID=2704465 RepID=A0A6C0GFC8_9BACT|nr:DUF6265 family protein [Rhodocytophaga rosea]QHT66442.1 hypothetical protein GXP67_07110 [Rhodocytophaga rosea]
MKRFSLFFFLTVLTALLSDVFAQTAQKTGSLADISFIKGHWKANREGTTIEADWTAPEGDNIVGYMRMMKDNKATLYELFAFEQTPQGLIVLVKHFKPGMIGVEEKEKSDRYHFIEASQGRMIVEKQGEPTRILYEKRGEDQFVIAVGKQQDSKWEFKDLFVFNRMK